MHTGEWQHGRKDAWSFLHKACCNVNHKILLYWLTACVNVLSWRPYFLKAYPVMLQVIGEMHESKKSQNCLSQLISKKWSICSTQFTVGLTLVLKRVLLKIAVSLALPSQFGNNQFEPNVDVYAQCRVFKSKFH